jgi:hypothetical protein
MVTRPEVRRPGVINIPGGHQHTGVINISERDEFPDAEGSRRVSGTACRLVFQPPQTGLRAPHPGKERTPPASPQSLCPVKAMAEFTVRYFKRSCLMGLNLPGRA